MTVEQALDSMSRFLGEKGTRPNTKESLFYLNRARRLVYPLEDWTHTIEYGCVTLDEGCCFVLPWSLESIRAAWVCGKPVETANEYYDSVDRQHLVRECGATATTFRTGRRVVLPFALNGQLIFSALNLDDAGVEVTVCYVTPGGSTRNETLELPDYFGDVGTQDDVGKVTSITKGRTRGVVTVRSGNHLLSMAHDQICLEHDEYKVESSCPASQIFIKGKKRFVEYTAEDFPNALDIESLDALEFAAMAIYAKSQNKISDYQNNLLLARTHLEVAKEDKETSHKGYENMRMPCSQLTDSNSRYY